MKKEFAFQANSISIRLDPIFILTLIVICLTGLLNEFVLAFASMFMHEMGHILTACIMRRKVYSIRILPVGFNAVIEEDPCSRLKQLAVHFGGPFINMLLFTASQLLYSCWLHQSKNLHFFALINIYLFAFNLMPVLPLDGGKILIGLLAGRVGLLHADKYTRRTSRILLVLTFLAGVVQLYVSKHNFSIMLISIYIFFKLKSDRMEAALMNVKNIIYRRSRLLKNGVYQARELVVLKSISLSEIIKNMDYDRFHLVYVLDDDLRLKKVFTEQQIIDAIFKYNSDLSFQELIEKEHMNNIT